MKVYAEIGLGNETVCSTEYEEGDHEYRVPRFEVPPVVRGYYLRAWIGKRVMILSTNDGLQFRRKDRNKIKLLFGVAGVSESTQDPGRNQS